MDWKQRDGTLPFKDWQQLDEQRMYPKCAWKQIDGELPYKDWPPFYTAAPPVHQEDYICVYDMVAKQPDFFQTNGLAILMPTLCEITEELNGNYELVLTHPIDEWGKWKTLLELNIIKANRQLFRIYKKRTTLSSDGSRQRTVYARHITYDLNDKLLEDVRPTNKNGQDFLKWIFDGIMQDDPEHHYIFYTFEYSSDIKKTATSYYQNVSPMAAMIGEDNCFINRLGGEIHRDNFRISINEHKEGSVQHKDAICYGFDMLEIEEDVDYTDLVTLLRVFDNFGAMWGVTTISPRLAHPIARAVTMNYEQSDMEQLVSDAENLFETLRHPSVTYTIRFADLKNTELYKDFIDIQNFNVGDTIPVYCEELDITTEQEVVKKTIKVSMDGVETTEIVLGNRKSALTRNDKLSRTISIGTAAEKIAKQAIEDNRLTRAASISTWKSANVYTWLQLNNIKWEEIKR